MICKIIGITGNSGSGKSTVSQMLTQMGGASIDADTLAHEAILPGQPAYGEILAKFGPDILGPDNKIDRKKLGAIVFNNPGKRTALEQIIHPRVIDRISEKIEVFKVNGLPFIVIDAVLLIESGLHKICDYVWLITASAENRLRRITVRDNLEPEAAQARMRSQRDTALLMPYVNTVICNDNGLDTLRQQVERALAL